MLFLCLLFCSELLFSLIVVLTSLFPCVFVATCSSWCFCDSLQPIVNVLLTALRVFFPCPPDLQDSTVCLLFYKYRNKPENMVSSCVPIFLVVPWEESFSLTLDRHRNEGTLRGGDV